MSVYIRISKKNILGVFTRIALINTIRPEHGTGDGITEYTYRLYKNLSGTQKVDCLYSVSHLLRYNVKGLLYTNTLFKNRLTKALHEKYDIVHITNQEMGFAAKIAKKVNSRAKVITTIQDLARVEGGVQKGLLQHAYNRIVRGSIKNALEYSDFIIFTSSQTKEDIGKYFDLENRYAVTNLAVKETALERVKPVNKKNDAPFNIGYIGSFASHKNVIFLLRAARLLRNTKYKFTLYGNGIEKENLLQFSRAHGLKNVYFMGFAPENKIAEIYDSFDAFVFPSMYEGFGMPILEAQARGKPVIIYARGKIPEEVGRYCFKARDEKHLAELLKNLSSKGYAVTLKKRATAYARSFTWGRTVNETLEIYRKLLKCVD